MWPLICLFPFFSSRCRETLLVFLFLLLWTAPKHLLHNENINANIKHKCNRKKQNLLLGRYSGFLHRVEYNFNFIVIAQNTTKLGAKFEWEAQVAVNLQNKTKQNTRPLDWFPAFTLTNWDTYSLILKVEHNAALMQLSCWSALVAEVQTGCTLHMFNPIMCCQGRLWKITLRTTMYLTSQPTKAEAEITFHLAGSN